MIGDGVVAMVDAKRHGRLWFSGPKAWRRAMKPFVESEHLMRLAGVAEAAFGLWLVHRQSPDPRSVSGID